MSKTILIVDDSSSVRTVVALTLRRAGYDVVEAADGREALGRLGQGKVHLVISDVNMPVMDGITFLREMKQKAEYRFTPVIMLTTESQDAKKAEGQAAGAKAWVVKPFQPQQMLAAVARLVAP